MKKISKERNVQRDEIVQTLTKLHEELTEQNGAVISAMEVYNATIDKINEQIDAAETLVSEVTTDMQAYIDEKSERWLEGESGGEYSEWKDTWDGVSFEKIDPLELPDVPDITLTQELDDLPSEPG